MADPKSETLCAWHGVAAASASATMITAQAARGRMNVELRIFIVAICHVKSGLTSIMASIGNALVHARTERNLTQTELAGCAATTPRRWDGLSASEYRVIAFSA